MTSEIVGQIDDWFWKYGVERGEYTIQPEGLYSLHAILERERAIETETERAKNGRACVAFWGPSQSGKSTFLSAYLDRDDDIDGAKSALSWGTAKVRFSPFVPLNSANGSSCTPPTTILFNPSNSRSDASGLVTRFFLPADERSVNPVCPVTLVLASQKQVLQALAIGYRAECQLPTDSESAREIVQRFKDDPAHAKNSCEAAFKLICVLCDVCKALSGSEPHFRPFAQEDVVSWMLRSSFTENVDAAWKLVSDVLWDGNEIITHLAQKILKFKAEHFSNCDRVIASLDAAATLEDIASLEKEKDRARRIRLLKDGRTLNVVLGGQGSYGVSLEDFGLLQACVGEMQIPLRRQMLGGRFSSFLERVDLLDLPGVTNHALGTDVGQGKKIDVSGKVDATTTFIQLLVRAYKTGKTLSVVYGQAENCSVDSFVIFVPLRQAGGVPKPQILDAGIRAWLAPYCGPDGFDFSKKPPLNLYINLSLFGEVAEEYANPGNSLKPLTELKLSFAKKECVDYFFTSNKFHPCRLTPEQISIYKSDDAFKTAFLDGLGGHSFDAQVQDGLGSDYMLERLQRDITPRARLYLYEKVKRDDISRAQSIISAARPPSLDNGEKRQRRVLQDVLDHICPVLEDGPDSDKNRVSGCIKKILYVDPSVLDGVIMRPRLDHADQVGESIRKQIQRWIANRVGVCVGSEYDSLLTDPSADMRDLLEALGCFSEEEAVGSVVKMFKFVNEIGLSREARAPFALLLSNLVMSGHPIMTDSNEETKGFENGNPADVLIEQFRVRVQALLDGGLNPRRRKALVGDTEIEGLAEMLSKEGK